MPDTTEQVSALSSWLAGHWLGVAFWGVVLVLAYRGARPLIHRGLLRVVKPPETDADVPVVSDAEVAKRVATLEALFSKIVNFALVLAVIVVIFSIFDLWPIIGGLGLVVAALTLAGQSIVLDYLSGILLIVEGPYFKGDVVVVGGVQGTVEEVGLRRTVVRDTSGTVHSVANGEIRVASNLTRLYAIARVDVVGISGEDVERAIAAMNAVGQEMYADPAWSDRLLEAPRYWSTPAFTDLGLTLRMTGRIRPTERWQVEAEIRRRLAQAFAAAGVVPNRRIVTAPPGASGPTGTGPTGSGTIPSDATQADSPGGAAPVS